MRSILLALTIAVTTASCDLFTETGGGIAIRLDASPLVAQLGDTVTFTVIVTANEVSGISISYGDSNGDTASTGGVPSISVQFKHAYLDTGNYMSRAAISDAVVGVRQVTQLIAVIPRDTTQPPVGQRTRSREEP